MYFQNKVLGSIMDRCAKSEHLSAFMADASVRDWQNYEQQGYFMLSAARCADNYAIIAYNTRDGGTLEEFAYECHNTNSRLKNEHWDLLCDLILRKYKA